MLMTKQENLDASFELKREMSIKYLNSRALVVRMLRFVYYRFFGFKDEDKERIDEKKFVT